MYEAMSPSNAFTTFQQRYILVAVQVVGLVTTVFVVWWLFAASDSMKAMAEELLSPVIGFFDSVIGWIRDKVSTLLGRQQSDAQEAYFQPLSGGEGLALDEEDARSPPLFPMR